MTGEIAIFLVYVRDPYIYCQPVVGKIDSDLATVPSCDDLFEGPKSI